MNRIVPAVFLMACHCGLSWASWEPLFEVARDSNRIVKSVGTQDTRGNRLVIRRDADGVFRGDLYLNAYLPAPDRPGAATAVVFSIDDRPPHEIDTGTWVEDGPYRRLNFRLSGPPDAGLDAAMIEILEGRQILFSYPAGTLGRETVRFSFADTGPLAADVLGVALPVDHAMHERLRADRLRLEAERRARPFRPVDPETERARHLLIERQRAMIRARVLDRWMRPAHWSGLSCALRITLMSTGEVLRVQVVTGSGDPEFDASMAEAARDASPLPLPADPALFSDFQQLDMVFDPAA